MRRVLTGKRERKTLLWRLMLLLTRHMFEEAACPSSTRAEPLKIKARLRWSTAAARRARCTRTLTASTCALRRLCIRVGQWVHFRFIVVAFAFLTRLVLVVVAATGTGTAALAHIHSAGIRGIGG